MSVLLSLSLSLSLLLIREVLFCHVLPRKPFMTRDVMTLRASAGISKLSAARAKKKKKKKEESVCAFEGSVETVCRLKVFNARTEQHENVVALSHAHGVQVAQHVCSSNLSLIKANVRVCVCLFLSHTTHTHTLSLPPSPSFSPSHSFFLPPTLSFSPPRPILT